MKAPGLMPDAHLFTHDAMNTTFSLRIRGVDEPAARAMARECYYLIDMLESRLSRFIAGSEVAQINAMRAGETLYLSEPCHQCLLLALNACANTGGLFDITLGSRIAHRKSGGNAPAPPLAGRLPLHPDVPAITCESPGREIDLGGIAKGFAIDQLQQLLSEWGAHDVLLAAGASSWLAFGPSAWPVDLTGDHESLRVYLTNQALGASGTGIQGNHILHPGGPDAMPARPLTRVWVSAPTAALAEIWSTALMLV
ncbi:MAG: FAD:protein FMN transferase, partial [Verrucomicrobia bacterium]|nr:FAD:protein FMN transferase [Verrucomicrobiota bacterium]